MMCDGWTWSAGGLVASAALVVACGSDGPSRADASDPARDSAVRDAAEPSPDAAVRAVRVTARYRGDVVAAAPVQSNDASGALVATATTDAAGQATLQVPDGGSVTVAIDRAPAPWEVYTLAGLVAQTEVVIGPVGQVRTGPTVPFTAAFPDIAGAASYQVRQGCGFTTTTTVVSAPPYAGPAAACTTPIGFMVSRNVSPGAWLATELDPAVTPSVALTGAYTPEVDLLVTATNVPAVAATVGLRASTHTTPSRNVLVRRSAVVQPVTDTTHSATVAAVPLVPGTSTVVLAELQRTSGIADDRTARRRVGRGIGVDAGAATLDLTATVPWQLARSTFDATTGSVTWYPETSVAVDVTTAWVEVTSMPSTVYWEVTRPDPGSSTTRLPDAPAGAPYALPAPADATGVVAGARLVTLPGGFAAVVAGQYPGGDTIEQIGAGETYQISYSP